MGHGSIFTSALCRGSGSKADVGTGLILYMRKWLNINSNCVVTHFWRSWKSEISMLLVHVPSNEHRKSCLYHVLMLFYLRVAWSEDWEEISAAICSDLKFILKLMMLFGECSCKWFTYTSTMRIRYLFTSLSFRMARWSKEIKEEKGKGARLKSNSVFTHQTLYLSLGIGTHSAFSQSPRRTPWFSSLYCHSQCVLSMFHQVPIRAEWNGSFQSERDSKSRPAVKRSRGQGVKESLS